MSSGRDIFLHRNTLCQWLILKIESIECSDIFPYFLIQHNSIVPEYQDWLIDYWQLLSVWSSVEKKYTSTGWIKKIPFYRTSEIRCLRALLISCWALKIKIFNREYFSHIIPIPATARVALVAFVMADWQLLRSRPQVRNLAKISGHFVVLEMWNWMSEWLCVDLDNLYSWICWHRWGDPVCEVNARIQCPNNNVVPILLRCGSQRNEHNIVIKALVPSNPPPNKEICYISQSNMWLITTSKIIKINWSKKINVIS